MVTLAITTVPVSQEHRLRADNNTCVSMRGSAVPVSGLPNRAQANRFLEKAITPPSIDGIRVLHLANPPILPS